MKISMVLGQEIWDHQGTDAENTALSIIRNELDQIISSSKDTTGPTIFAPWVTPENPGGKMWGNNCLKDAPKIGTVHTFIHDISTVKRAEIIMRIAGKEIRHALLSRGAYPSQTNPQVTSNYYTVELPEGAGDIRYFIEAEDGRGNVSRGALEWVFCA